MTENILISVIIPFYNHIDWLTQAVNSVLLQTYTTYEIIVIDDGSTVDTSEFLEIFKNRIIYKKKENNGPGSARNLGIELSRGKYIAFLDSDDLWEAQKLENQVSFMEKTGAVWSHTNYSIFKNNDTTESKLVDLSYFHGRIFPLCLATSPIATPCVMILRKFFEENPGFRFSENMRFGQDWFLWINLATRLPIYVLPESYTMVRIRGSNAALRARVQIRARSQIIQYMRTQPDRFFGRMKAGHLIRFAFSLCDMENTFLSWLENNLISNNKILELLSKIGYVIPYIIFKLIKTIQLKNIK
jgi:teichuronic acid biosynthesis glycosyltransferase TuaG